MTAPADRTLVAWIGALDPDDRRELEQREFAVQQCALASVPEPPYLRAAVMQYDPSRPRELASFALAVPTWIDHGVLCLVRVPSPGYLEAVQHLLGDTVRRVSLRAGPAYAIAQEVARTPAEPGVSLPLRIISDAILPAGCEILLRRAFYDFTSIDLEPLASGRANVAAWVAHASRLEQQRPLRPLPFFAKIAQVSKIAVELDRYSRLVDPFVPFGLRPQIDHARSVRGAALGILIGRFVEHSEELGAVVLRGTSGPALSSLFDQTLRGWRAQSAVSAEGFANIDTLVRSSEIPPERYARGRMSPSDLMGLLARAGSARLGPIHGDLHLGNVRVRGNDAIMIDFDKTEDWMPQAFDPATLEVSIPFAAPASSSLCRQMWNRLYSVSEVRRPDPVTQRSPLETFERSVRQVRALGLSAVTRPDEYAWCVVAALLVHARRPSRGDTEARHQHQDRGGGAEP